MEDETYTVGTARSWWKWDGGGWLPLDEDQLATIEARMNNQLQTQVDAAIMESLWPGLRHELLGLKPHSLSLIPAAHSVGRNRDQWPHDGSPGR